MTLSEIKTAVDAGKTVHWASSRYVVTNYKGLGYLISDLYNGSCTGLTWRDGVTLNGKECEFFIGGKDNEN